MKEKIYTYNEINYKLITDYKDAFDNEQVLAKATDYFNEYDYFLEGTNLTDLLEDRPGILVRKTYNMTSPLIECGITKNDVFNMIYL